MKKILIIIGGLIIALVALAVITPFFISADIYKNQIIAKVEAATGRTLTIDGALSISFFPTAGITAEKVTLSNPKGFDDSQPFIALDTLRIDVAVMPLLNKEIVIKNFTLKAPVINLHVDKNGMKNWVFTSQTAASEAKPDGRPQMVRSNASYLPGNIQLSNFELKDGTVTYTNGIAPAVALKKINASVVLQSSADAASVDGSGEWNGKTVSIKAGIGTLKSLLETQKAEINLALKSDLFVLAADGNYDKGAFTGKETFKAGSLKEIAQWLNPGKSLSTTAKLAFQTESALNCGANYCSLNNGVFALDALAAKGNIRIAFGDSKPAIDIKLTTDKLDLNSFLPPDQQSSLENPLIADANAQISGRWSNAPIDLSALTAFNGNIAITADNLLYRKISLGKTQLNIKLQQGVLNADIPNAILYHGTASLSLNVNANAPVPLCDAHVLLKAVEIQPLLTDAADIQNVSGLADIQANIQSSGSSMKSFISSLSGQGQIRLRNGEIKQVSIIDMLHNVTSAFDNAGATAQNTIFTQMSGSFTITSGVVSNRDLAMDTPGLNVSGEGNVNLPAYTIDYRLSPKLVNNSGGQAKDGLAIPIIIEGSLDHPRYRPDLKSAVQDALQDPSKLKEQLKNSKQSLKQQLKNPEAVKDIKNLLRGLGR